MKRYPAIKLLILLSSISLGGMVIWSMKETMQKPSGDSESSASTEEDPPPMITSTKNPGRVDTLNEQPLLPGSKSAGAGLRSGDFETTKESVDDILQKAEPKEKKKKKSEQRPLIPSTKSAPILPEKK